MSIFLILHAKLTCLIDSPNNFIFAYMFHDNLSLAVWHSWIWFSLDSCFSVPLYNGISSSVNSDYYTRFWNSITVKDILCVGVVVGRDILRDHFLAFFLQWGQATIKYICALSFFFLLFYQSNSEVNHILHVLNWVFIFLYTFQFNKLQMKIFHEKFIIMLCFLSLRDPTFYD